MAAVGMKFSQLLKGGIGKHFYDMINHDPFSYPKFHFNENNQIEFDD
jgi:hypothetical protein